MADGILKSNPEEIWNYFVSLNKGLGYIEEAVKDVHRTFGHLEERLRKKRQFLWNKQDELEAELRSLFGRLNQAKDEKERAGIQARIASVKKELDDLREKDLKLMQSEQKLPLYLKDLTSAQKNCVSSFSKGKRVLNAYLKLVEVEAAQGEFQDYPYSGTPGQFGVMKYRGTTFYCNNNAFDPLAKDDKNRTNIQRMEKGMAPLGYDGKSVELHHMIQTEDGGIMEVTGTKHREGHTALHINTSDIPSGINRPSFDVLRVAYWKRRAAILKAGGIG